MCTVCDVLCRLTTSIMRRKELETMRQEREREREREKEMGRVEEGRRREKGRVRLCRRFSQILSQKIHLK